MIRPTAAAHCFDRRFPILDSEEVIEWSPVTVLSFVDGLPSPKKHPWRRTLPRNANSTVHASHEKGAHARRTPPGVCTRCTACTWFLRAWAPTKPKGMDPTSTLLPSNASRNFGYNFSAHIHSVGCERLRDAISLPRNRSKGGQGKKKGMRRLTMT